MMTYFPKSVLVLCILGLSPIASAGIMKDFDSLGGNDVLMERAEKLQPEKSISVVQNRVVDRRIRHEFSLGYGNYLGGDAYIKTQAVDLGYNFHLNPYFAVGMGYFSAFNKFTKEGRYSIDVDELIPDVDAPQSGYEVVVHGYPMYGKVNLIDRAVLHFDFYGLASYGKMKLVSGEVDQFSVGAGMGMWISQHLTSRIELRQRYYTAQRINSTADMSQTVLSFSVGYLL